MFCSMEIFERWKKTTYSQTPFWEQRQSVKWLLLCSWSASLHPWTAFGSVSFGQLHGSQETKGQLHEDVRESNEVGGGRARPLAAAEFPGQSLGFAALSSQSSCCCYLDLLWCGWLRNLEGGPGDFTTRSEAAQKSSGVGVVAGESLLMKCIRIWMLVCWDTGIC